MKTYFVKTADGTEKVWALQAGNNVWVHFRGETWLVEPKVKGKKKTGGQNAVHDGDILAPMPGKIIKVPVTSGQKVELGQVVIVMEAMKMEYTLTASKAGTVGQIDCREGQQVELGQLLTKIGD
jgi:acetyl/propionyl-CoA carboxylase alpha subunit